MNWPPPVESPAMRAAPGPFAQIRVRWLPVVAIGSLILLLVASVGWQSASGGEPPDEVFGIVMFAPLLAWLAWTSRRNGINWRAWYRWPRLGTYWFVVVGLTFALLAFSLGAGGITSALFPGYTDGAAVSPQSGFWLLFISLVIVPPVVEELIFRGFLLERWAVKWRLGVAVLAQAVAFGVLHVDPVGAGMFGVCLALMTIRTASLWPAMIMHAINNGIVLVAVFAAGDAAAGSAEPQSPGEALIAALVFWAVSLPFLALFLVRNWPTATTLTAYERTTLGPAGLPPRHLGRVTVVAGPYGLAGRTGRLAVDDTGLAITRGRAILTTATWSALAEVAVAPDSREVWLAARDGGQLRLRLDRRSGRQRRGVTTALQQRFAPTPRAVSP